jgi:hypothetical protein
LKRDGQRLIVREPGSLTRRALEAVLDQNRVRPKVGMEISRDAVREAVAADFGAGVVSRTEFVPDDRLTALPVSDHKPFTESYAACLKLRRSLRQIDAFMQLVQQLQSSRSDGESPDAGS